MAEVILNAVETQVNMAAGVSSTDVAITVDDGSVFPSVDEFRISIDDEIMLVTARAANVLTVTRGEEGTVATAHANRSTVASTLTAAGLAAALGGGAGGGSAFLTYLDLKIASGPAYTEQVEANNLNAYQNPASNGDHLRGVLYLAAGTYHIKRETWVQPNMGIVQCKIDGVAVGSVDCYDAGSGAWSVVDVGSFTCGEGHHLYEETITGKNGASSGYYCLHSVVGFVA